MELKVWCPSSDQTKKRRYLRELRYSGKRNRLAFWGCCWLLLLGKNEKCSDKMLSFKLLAIIQNLLTWWSMRPRYVLRIHIYVAAMDLHMHLGSTFVILWKKKRETPGNFGLLLPRLQNGRLLSDRKFVREDKNSGNDADLLSELRRCCRFFFLVSTLIVAYVAE